MYIGIIAPVFTVQVATVQVATVQVFTVQVVIVPVQTIENHVPLMMGWQSPVIFDPVFIAPVQSALAVDIRKRAPAIKNIHNNFLFMRKRRYKIKCSENI